MFMEGAPEPAGTAVIPRLSKANLPALAYCPAGVPASLASALANYAGFPTILDERSVPMKEVGHFIRTCCPSPKTAVAYRDDVFEFMAGLEAQGRYWNDPSLIDDDFRAYRNMLCATTGTTGRKRRAGTIRRRLAGLRAFYSFAASKGYVPRGFDWTSINALPQHLLRSDEEQEARSLDSGAITYIPSDHMARILWMLGPSTSSEVDREHDGRPLRDRLCVETSFETGLRVDEVTHLTVRHVPALPGFDPSAKLDREFFDRARRHPKLPVRVSWTKRLAERTILLPYDLVWWLNWYLRVERAEVLDRARRRLGTDEFRRRGLDRQAWLFLNGADAPDAYTAGRFSEAVASRWFSAAVVAAGYSREREGKPPAALYTFHDLRHTFAILHYLSRLDALSRKGTSGAEERAIEWVQTLLGHRSRETTRRHYVNVGRLIEARLSDGIDGIVAGRLRRPAR